MHESQHTKLTLEKKILLLLLPGFELATFQSLAQHSNQQALLAIQYHLLIITVIIPLLHLFSRIFLVCVRVHTWVTFAQLKSGTSMTWPCSLERINSLFQEFSDPPLPVPLFLNLDCARNDLKVCREDKKSYKSDKQFKTEIKHQMKKRDHFCAFSMWTETNPFRKLGLEFVGDLLLLRQFVGL